MYLLLYLFSYIDWPLIINGLQSVISDLPLLSKKGRLEGLTGQSKACYFNLLFHSLSVFLNLKPYIFTSFVKAVEVLNSGLGCSHAKLNTATKQDSFATRGLT